MPIPNRLPDLPVNEMGAIVRWLSLDVSCRFCDGYSSVAYIPLCQAIGFNGRQKAQSMRYDLIHEPNGLEWLTVNKDGKRAVLYIQERILPLWLMSLNPNRMNHRAAERLFALHKRLLSDVADDYGYNRFYDRLSV